MCNNLNTFKQSLLMFPTYISNMVHTEYPNMYPNGSPFLLPYLGYKMTYEPIFHICVL